MTNELTKEQWQAIAEELAEYLEDACADIDCSSETCCSECPLYRGSDTWIERTKKELGYNEVDNGNS